MLYITLIQNTNSRCYMRFSARNGSGLMKAEIAPCVMQTDILNSVFTEVLHAFGLIVSAKRMLHISQLYKFKRGV